MCQLFGNIKQPIESGPVIASSIPVDIWGAMDQQSLHTIANHQGARFTDDQGAAISEVPDIPNVLIGDVFFENDITKLPI